MHYLEFSDDPDAQALWAWVKDKEEMLGQQDKGYWSNHVPAHYHQYSNIFSKAASERMPTCKPYDHPIELVKGATLPKLAKLYPLNPQEQNSLDSWIDEHEAKGYIWCSKSPAAAPMFFVKKKDGSLCLVQDYQALNAATKKDKFPIPQIPDLIDRLSQSSIFTSLDLRWGYNNVHIWEGDEEKAVFITHRGLYDPQ